MKVVILEGNQMNHLDTVHDYMKKQLGLSEHYGKSLDALWDALSTYPSPLVIQINGVEVMKEALGVYGIEIIELFDEIGGYNKAILVKFEN